MEGVYRLSSINIIIRLYYNIHNLLLKLCYGKFIEGPFFTGKKKDDWIVHPHQMLKPLISECNSYILLYIAYLSLLNLWIVGFSCILIPYSKTELLITRIRVDSLGGVGFNRDLKTNPWTIYVFSTFFFFEIIIYP